jgi:ABC-type amino acid transport substrate-binding protein
VSHDIIHFILIYYELRNRVRITEREHNKGDITMKKKFVPGILLLVLGLMIAGCGNKNEASSGAGADSGQKTIVAATSGVSNPFSYDKDGKLTGYDVEVMKAIFE